MIDNIVAIDPMESVTITELNFVKHYGKAGEDLLDRVRDTEREKILSEVEEWVEETAYGSGTENPSTWNMKPIKPEEILAKLNQLKGTK